MMTEEKRTKHVLKDEKLGIDREYVAVDRNAKVGETIVVTKAEYVEGEIYEIGHYGKVYNAHGDGVVSVDFNGFDNSFVDDDGEWIVGDGVSAYHVLEPTDIFHIDGERYRLEERKAEVGEKVIYVNNENGESDGVVAVVSDVGLSSVDVIEYEDYDGETMCGFSHDAYRVLTTVKDAAEPKESDVITVLANIGAEVAELKRKNEQFEQALGWNEMGPGHIPNLRNGLSELKSVVSVLEEKYETELERMQAEIDALHEDKVRLGEQLAKVTADIGGKTELSGTFIADVIIGLKRAGL
ncbi:hypothetical protein [Bacillus pumilus]|uniref:Uncharacterized protein n=1 Tax=Bacillus pumilus TaxID=1408 RepID=A0AAE4BA13_BACPU|nr:hypothetical protein [Bacillus pumilus]MDR4250734.1 hypothetical protein [Bacillus pumilus]